MPIMPPFTRKKAAAPPAAAEEEAQDPNLVEEEEGEDGESPSDIDAPKMVGGKPNPLKMWAAAKTGR